MLDTTTIQKLAQQLVDAENRRSTIQKPSLAHPELTLHDAYAIQDAVLDLRLLRGEQIAGAKVALTGTAIQQKLGATEPAFALFTNAGARPGDESLALSQTVAPCLEPEIAFVLKDDLKGPFVSEKDVVNATRGVCPAFEIVDTRYGAYDFTLVDLVADSASFGGLVLGKTMVPASALDFSNIRLDVLKNGEPFAQATSAAVMGSPVASVAWLANKLLSLGRYLKAGDTILSGSFTPFLPISAGDTIEARFEGVGSVSLKVEA